MISAVYEKRDVKIDHYVPGTRIPILSDDDLLACDVWKTHLKFSVAHK